MKSSAMTEGNRLSLLSGSVRRAALLGLAGIVLLGGCKSAPPTDSSAAPAPAPAAAPAPGPDQSAAAPVPAPPPEQAAAPAPPPPPPPPKIYTVPAGTALAVRLSQTLSSKSSNVGDPFSGTLAQSVHVKGVTVLRAGLPVSGTVIGARKQGRFKGEGDLAIQLNRVGSYSVTTQEYEQNVKGKGKRSTAMVAGGGGGGALIGGLAGGGKGALIGGLIGAGAGTAGAAFTGNKGVTMEAESVVTFVSSSPITVTEKPKSEE